MTTWHACTHDWPVGGTPLSTESIRRVLGQFDQHFPAAVESLACTSLPEPAARLAAESTEEA